MGIQINGSNDTISATDGGLSISGQSIENANLVLSQNLSVSGIATLGTNVVGSAVTINSTGINVSGVVTATSFKGDGSTLTGVAATSNISTNAIVNSGVTTVAAGSASVPSISPTGDSNTGIFFPAADTIAFGEGGSEAARFDSSGRFGIGTQSPTARFDVGNIGGNVTGGDFKVDTTNGSATVTVGRASSTGGDHTNFLVTDRVANMRFLVDVRNDVISFGYGASEMARFDASGRLLIGTSSTSRTTRISVTGNSAGASNEHGVVDLQFSGTAPGNGWALGYLNFADTSTGNAARIGAERDGGTWTSGSSMPGRLVFSTTADGASSPTERVRISNSGDFICPSIYNNSVANAANVYVAANGQLYRSTSSIKYKTDIETLQDSYADAILGCRPVWYRSTSSGDNPNHGFWGFIAEEVAAVDPRLVQWKTAQISYDEKGSAVETQLDTPEPDGVQYDRFVPHLLNLIKRQKEQIEAQGTAIAALEARLSALEAQ